MSSLPSPLDPVARAFYHAKEIGLSPMEYRHWTPSMMKKGIPREEGKIETRRPFEHEMSVIMFPQSWGSTALGFGGMGGSAITDAYTVIVRHPNRREVCVYFNGEFAYRIERPNQKFRDDMARQQMAAVSGASKYEEPQPSSAAEG